MAETFRSSDACRQACWGPVGQAKCLASRAASRGRAGVPTRRSGARRVPVLRRRDHQPSRRAAARGLTGRR